MARPVATRTKSNLKPTLLSVLFIHVSTTLGLGLEVSPTCVKTNAKMFRAFGGWDIFPTLGLALKPMTVHSDCKSHFDLLWGHCDHFMASGQIYRLRVAN